MTRWKKNKILKLARESDCDLDGDICYFHGKTYYVNIFREVVVKKKASKWIKDIPRFFFFDRFYMNGSSLSVAQSLHELNKKRCKKWKKFIKKS